MGQDPKFDEIWTKIEKISANAEHDRNTSLALAAMKAPLGCVEEVAGLPKLPDQRSQTGLSVDTTGADALSDVLTSTSRQIKQPLRSVSAEPPNFRHRNQIPSVAGQATA